MFRKVMLVLLVVLVLAIGIGAIHAQDTTPRGGTVVINEGNSSGWVRNFNPFSPDPRPGTTRFVYEPMVIYNQVDGGKPTYWLADSSAYADDLKSVSFTL